MTAKKQTKPGATMRRYIVEWRADGKPCGKEFLTLRRAEGFAKDMRKTAQRLVKSGHDEDGDLAALVESVRIYAATLEPIGKARRATA